MFECRWCHQLHPWDQAVPAFRLQRSFKYGHVSRECLETQLARRAKAKARKLALDWEAAGQGRLFA